MKVIPEHAVHTKLDNSGFIHLILYLFHEDYIQPETTSSTSLLLDSRSIETICILQSAKFVLCMY